MKYLLLPFLCLPLVASDFLINPYAYATDPLNTSLVSYWKLEEASGTRVDQKGVNDLTPANTPGQGTGKIGSCATLTVAGSQTLSKTNNASFDPLTNAWTISFWFNSSVAFGSARSVLGFDDGSTQRRLVFDISSQQMVLYCFTNASTTAFLSVTASTFGNLSHNTWYHCVGSFNRSTGNLKVYINNTANTTANVPANPTKTAPFTMGVLNKWDGSVDEVAMWSRELTAAEVARVYNSGNGKSCCAFSSP